MVRSDDEVEVFFSDFTRWGLNVVTSTGLEGFVDNLKVPSDLDREGLVRGQEMTVVVLDVSRTPFRASLMEADFRAARDARGKF
jgi:hypothetical protein